MVVFANSPDICRFIGAGLRKGLNVVKLNFCLIGDRVVLSKAVEHTFGTLLSNT
jgi:hypothetical protein